MIPRARHARVYVPKGRACSPVGFCLTARVWGQCLPAAGAAGTSGAAPAPVTRRNRERRGVTPREWRATFWTFYFLFLFVRLTYLGEEKSQSAMYQPPLCRPTPLPGRPPPAVPVTHWEMEGPLLYSLFIFYFFFNHFLNLFRHSEAPQF